jgi:hypothetical protein
VDYLVSALRQNPELAIFLTIAVGFHQHALEQRPMEWMKLATRCALSFSADLS